MNKLIAKLFPKNKKGITPIIAIILLLMMTVAVAGAAFFWLSRIQNQVQGGVESYQRQVLAQTASSVIVIDASYNDTADDLIVYLQNIGSTIIPVSKSDDFPTTTWIFRDGNQNVICGTDWSDTSDAECTSGCDTDMSPGQVLAVTLALDPSGDCSISSRANGTIYSFTIDFSGKTTTSGSFVK